MKVQINTTSFSLRNDTESVKETPGAVKFCDDHGVVFERVIIPKSGVIMKTCRIRWHESMSTVEVPCSTIAELQQYCKDYDATFEVKSDNILISFNGG